MDAIRHNEINKTAFTIDGIYNYTVDTWTSVDGGKTFYYCGITKFFKTLQEARAYKRKLDR